MIGEKIRTIRKSKSLSIAALASLVGVTDSYISQLERNVADPSVSVLRKISAALDTPVTAFFDESYEEPVLLRRTDLQTCPAPVEGMQLNWLSPVPSVWGNHMEIFQFTLSPGPAEDTLRHDGDTCIYLTQGAADIHLQNTSYSLKKGDSIYIQSNAPYRMENTGPKSAAGILCTTGPVRKDSSL